MLKTMVVWLDYKVNELLQTYPLGVRHEYPWILSKPIYVTYVDGSCALYRVESILKCLGNKLFIDEFLVMAMTTY